MTQIPLHFVTLMLRFDHNREEQSAGSICVAPIGIIMPKLELFSYWQSSCSWRA
ncbi:hypothetical protein PC118_g17785, partial [Phytophthora cactorum]